MTTRTPLMPDGREKPGMESFGGKTFFRRQVDMNGLQMVGQFRGRDRVVAANHRQHQLSIGLIGDGLEKIGFSGVEESHEVGNGLDSGRGNFFHGGGGTAGFCQARLHALCLFGVRAVVAMGADHKAVFAVGRFEHEFMGTGSTHDAGIGLDGNAVQPAPGKDPQIGVEDPGVIGIQIGKVPVKAVGILHEKLANPQQPASRTRFVTNLGLNVVEHHRQVPVGAKEVLGNVGHGFFVGHGQDEFTVFSVLEADQLRPDIVIAFGLLPELRRVEDRHGDLDPGNAVQFFPNDIFDFFRDAMSQRQQGINPRRNRIDIAASEEENMRRCFSLFRDLKKGVNKIRGISHLF